MRANHSDGGAVSHVLFQPRAERGTSHSVDRDDQSAKFWLDPVALARNLGFGPAELRRIHRLVVENRNLLLEKWHERFPS